MAWIELHQTVWTHRKTISLGCLLDIRETYAAGHVIRLWTWALDNAGDGDLSLLHDRIIARGADWDGDPTQFVRALTESGFLDDDGKLHDWSDYAGRLIERRRQDAERKRMSRGRPRDVRRTSGRGPKPVTRTSGVTVPNLTNTGDIPPGPPLGRSEALSAPSGAAPEIQAPSTPLGRCIEAIRAAGIEPAINGKRDGKALKENNVDPLDVAAVFIAVARDEYGDDFMRKRLMISEAVGWVNGHKASKHAPAPKRPSKNGRRDIGSVAVRTDRDDERAAELAQDVAEIRRLMADEGMSEQDAKLAVFGPIPQAVYGWWEDA